jgi:hypothetical protein
MQVKLGVFVTVLLKGVFFLHVPSAYCDPDASPPEESYWLAQVLSYSSRLPFSRPRRTNTETFEPDANVQQPRQRKKKRTVKRALTSELKNFSEKMRKTESFANRVAAKKVIERSKKELARANTILQAEKHRDHNKLMERVKRRHLSTAQSRRHPTSLASLVKPPARRSSAIDRPTTSLS